MGIPLSTRFKYLWYGIRSAMSGVANPEEWLVAALGGGGKTLAGTYVTEVTALKSTAVLACVKVLGETIASLPLNVYRELQPRGKEKCPSHRLHYLIHKKPNEEMTSFTYRESMMTHLLLWGNHYSEIEFDNAGRVVALWPLPPWMVNPRRDSKTKKIVYDVYLPEGGMTTLQAWQVLHIPAFGFDGLKGKSPISLAREAVGLALATEEFGARFFGDGAHVSGVIEMPGDVESPELFQKYQKSFNEKYAGLGKSHRLMLLELGMKFTPVTMPAEDAQFIQTRKFQTEEIARVFRVPLHLVQNLDRATFNNIEQLAIEFVVHTVRPWLVRIEQAMDVKLFSSADQKRYFIKFVADGLLRGDIKSRYEAYRTGILGGWLCPDEVREFEDMNPREDGLGKVYYQPANMVPAGGNPPINSEKGGGNIATDGKEDFTNESGD